MKTMRKLVLFGLFVLLLCFATSCGKENAKETAKDKPGTVYVLNGFEDSRDLFSLRPSVQQMSASMEIVGKDDGQVKAGKGSMKYSYERGNWPDMVLHIRESEYPKLDIANLNKMNLSVYNDSEKEVSGSIAVVVGRNKTLLTEDFTLEPNQWNELDFRLSALACEYNADQILGFRFRMKAEEGTVFYFDEWSVTMGAENTEEDDKWEPILLEIIERIDKLPKEITLKDEEELEELYMDYAELPELYRNIVPNYSSLYATIQQFVDVKFASEEDALERKLLAFDEFYGIGQIDSANYSMMYQTDVKFEDEKGSIKVAFDGATKESYFPYKIPLDPKRYDYVEVSFFNDDVYRKVIYFNWVQRIVIEPQTWGTLKIPGKELMKEGNLIVDTIDEQGTRINSSGTVYMGAMHAYRRDLLAELNKLPNASDVRMKRDIKYLTLIERTMQLYQDTPEVERVNIPKDLVANLEACYAKISGYSTVFDATQEDIQFGTPDCKAVGEFAAAEDKDYGPVWELNFTAKADGAYAAGFQFTKEFSENKNMFFYIYNPKSTAQTMELYSDGAWNNLGMHTLEPGWNEIAVSTDVPSNYFIFGLFAKTQDVVGTWKVSSLYQVSDAIVNREAAAVVSELIKALPDASKIQMPRDLKYVADIWEAYEAYEALAPGGKSGVSSALKNNLNACMKAIEGYKASINANTDEMTVGTPDCVCSGNLNRKYDETYGAVFGLDITKAGTGDYAAGFQVNKDISADKNLFFYMYNPKKAAQTMYLYANPTWDNMGEQVLNPGWNLIELPKDAKIDKYLFGLFPKNADVEGEWLITSVYSKSADVVNAEEASAVKALISNLPNASSIEMPRDLKKVTGIAAAGDAYQALSADAKKKITSTEKAKLDACLKAIEGYTAAINAITDTMTVGTPDAPCQGVMNRKEDATYGPVFALNITGAGTGDYAGGFQVNKDISAYKHMFFYINNPQDTAQTMYLYADPSWKDLGARTLNPGWNLIEIPNEIKIERYIFGIFPKTANAVGEWQITSIYAKSDAVVDKEQSKATSDMINALPDASTIQMPDDIRLAASIYQAKDNYDTLTSAAKAYITGEQLAKLNACMAAIDGYKVVVNALTDEMSVGTPDAPCQGVLNRTDDAQAGPVFGLNITAAGTGAYAGGFQVNKDMSAESNMTFSIYNPFDSNRTMWLYADPSWKDLGAQDLVPGWNKIEIPNNISVEKYVFGLFPGGTDVVGDWKITSFYALSDEVVMQMDAAAVELTIQALTDAETLTIDDKDAVNAAKAAYDALSDGAKALVSQASKDKLTACVAKIAELEEAANQPEETTGIVVAYTQNPGHFDYYSDATNSAYADGQLADIEVSGKIAKWTATVNVTSQNGGLARVYQSLALTTSKLEEYKAQGYTHLHIPYYLEAPADTEIQVHSDGWEWNYKKSADAVRNAWTTFAYPIDDLLLTYGGTNTVLDGINAKSRGAFGLMNLKVNATGTYKISLGEATLWGENVTPDEEESTSVTIAYATSTGHWFDYYSDATNCAYADATLADVEVAGKTAKWSATLNVTSQNGGLARAYQGLALTVQQLQEYKAQGYTHVRIPYYLEAPADTNIQVHSDGWEWNYKKSADAVRNEWTNFDYPIDDLLLTYGSTRTVLEGINSGARAAFGLMNLQVNATGTYKLYLGQAEVIKPTEEADPVVEYNSTNGHWFDYYSDATNSAYADAVFADTEVAGKTAKWSATLNVTSQNGGFARAYQGLNLTVQQLQEYKTQGYTHVRIPYYLEAPADTNIYVHSDSWEWNYKQSAVAVRGVWTNFDYPIDDLLLTYGGTATVLDGINSGGRGAFGLMALQVNATGTYKLYLGGATLVTK